MNFYACNATVCQNCLSHGEVFVKRVSLQYLLLYFSLYLFSPVISGNLLQSACIRETTKCCFVISSVVIEFVSLLQNVNLSVLMDIYSFQSKFGVACPSLFCLSYNLFLWLVLNSGL